MNAKNKKPQTFEESLERLEAIVKEMEGGTLGLDEMTKRFEEGQNLIDFCTKKLDEVERKVEKLVKKGGEVHPEPFEPVAEEGDNAENIEEDKG